MPILNTIASISEVLNVNEKKTVELLVNKVIPCVTTGSGKRTTYYTSEMLIDYAANQIQKEYKIPSDDYKQTFLTKGLNGPIVKSNKECEVITVTNQKGGIGKTTDSVNISVALAKLGKKVLLLDMDSQAQSSRYFKKVSYKNKSIATLFREYELNSSIDKELIKSIIITVDWLEDNEYSIDILPSEIKLSKILEYMRTQRRPETILSKIIEKIKEDYDYIIIDTPPYSGLSLEMSMFATNKVVLATEAEEFSIEGLETTIDEIKDINDNSQKNIKIDAIFVNSYSQRQTHQQESLSDIMDIMVDLDLDDLYTVKYSPVIGSSQKLQLSIIEYKKKVKDALMLSEPFFKYAIKLIEERD